jgi:hypothetical protein
MSFSDFHLLDQQMETSPKRIWANQPIHLFLLGCLNPCLQGTNVQWGDSEIGTLCNSKDSAHIAGNFDTLPSARKLLFIHRILDKKITVMSTTCVPNFKARRFIKKKIFKIY